MRAKGINYDTGFFHKGSSSREPFDAEIVARELRIIRDDLHCNAVRVTGGDPERLEIAAGIAARLGLEVWFSPFTCNLAYDEMIELLADCAERAERLRQAGAEIVLVLGAEISLLNNGFLPGDTLDERIKLLADLSRLRTLMPQVPPLVNDFFSRAVPVVRERFGGKITYAAMPFEGVDWTKFDIISLDLYRTADVADRYAAGIRSLVAQGRPVAITEFGACTFKGAAEQGARGWEIIEWDATTATPVGVNGEYIRDEEQQATYICELLDIFRAEGVDSAFIFTFASYQLPHRADPREDLDLGAYGIVKVYDDRFGDTYTDLRWEPKVAFAAIAENYGRS